LAFLLNSQAQGVSGKNEQSTQTPWRGAPDAQGQMQLYRLHRPKAGPDRRKAKCTAVPLQIVELSHSHASWLLVDTKIKIPLLNHQNRIETTVSTRLRIASVSSNIFEAVVANKA